MSSIMTNTGAMTALQTLRNINSNLETTQSRISTGLRVNNAADNAAYWSIATTMRSDNKALSTVKDALGLGAAKVDTAYTGMKAAIDVVDEIKAKITAAKEPGVDKAKVQKEVEQLQKQLKTIVGSSSFSGENWLQGATGSDKSIVGSFNRDASNNVSIGTLDFDTAKSLLIETGNHAAAEPGNAAGGRGLLTSKMSAGLTPGDPAATPPVDPEENFTEYSLLELDLTDEDINLDEALLGVDGVLQKMTDAAADLGAMSKRISIQEEFVSNLMDTIDKGVGRLVDADMSEESTRLQALQTQQQLGIQALSIANSNSQNILALFR